MDKKAQNITITTIVIIVLALIVLVVLIFGFTSGWGNLWSRITSIFGGGANVDSIVQACSIACSTQAQYDYCTRERQLVLEDKTKIPGTCYVFWTEHADLGFESCNLACEEADTTLYNEIEAKEKCEEELVASGTAQEKAKVCSNKKRVTEGNTYVLKTCEELKATDCVEQTA